MYICLYFLQISKNTTLNGDGDSDEDDDDDEDFDAEAEETALESYETPLDKEGCGIDEYIIFKTILTSKELE